MALIGSIQAAALTMAQNDSAVAAGESDQLEGTRKARKVAKRILEAARVKAVGRDIKIQNQAKQRIEIT
jgi:hypothetical protein